ncbi:hypothetical protein DAPPUDRAFT_236623 [Daphnia pulex]|uniref:Uncharacterized protein n=1 Tax=Daphnia pulex TaxID=6669 RepID=E9G2P8_DAPPU|nr:hypothetical protein DAPPUDRAFT_236623 [Daphnia pulex]|eukprot:EFX86086.1 hypothetical protein DAPPUDRAFT_236623 [Daphnia pulex]
MMDPWPWKNKKRSPKSPEVIRPAVGQRPHLWLERERFHSADSELPSASSIQHPISI